MNILHLRNAIAKFAADDGASVPVEYGLIAVLIGVGIIVNLKNVRVQMDAMYGNVVTAMQSANSN